MHEGIVKTIGFEGANRVGKGVQMCLLSEALESAGIPVITIRGDGSRTGLGDSPGDPYSEWWQDVNAKLREPETDKSLWNYAAYRLARELLIWRDRVLPKQVQAMDSEYGVLLVDRNLLSRTMIPREMDPGATEIVLYGADARCYSGRPKGRVLDEYDVCPDIIFELVAPKEVLLGRIRNDDPKGDFRRWLIEERYDWYLNATDYLPDDLQTRVHRVDSSLPIDVVQGNIRDLLLQNLNINY